LDHMGLPSVPAASASPARQTSASANAIARRSVARGELRLGPHAARPRSNSLNWAILRVLVFGGNLFFVFLSIHKDLAIVCRSVKPKPAQPEQGRREKVRWSRRNDDHERCAIHGANSSPRQNAAGCAARTALHSNAAGQSLYAVDSTQLPRADRVRLHRHPARCHRPGSAHVQQVSVLFVAALVRRDFGQVEPKGTWRRPTTLAAPRASSREREEKERRGGRGARARKRARAHTHTRYQSRDARWLQPANP